MCPRPWPISRSAGWDARTRSPRPCFGSAARRPASCWASRFPSVAATPPAEPRPRRTVSTTNPFGLRRSHRPRRLRYLLALLATISLSACGGGDENGDQAANSSEGTPIRITFGDTVLTARLHDNATARDLAAQLPLTLTFLDHNNVEKTAPLPRE